MGRATLEPTPFGRHMRSIRALNGERLVDMAARLGTSKSYLSYVETGRRNVPQDWIEPLLSLYGEYTTRDALERVVSDSRSVDRLDVAHLSYEEKRLLYQFVERLPHLTTKERKQWVALATTHDTKEETT